MLKETNICIPEGPHCFVISVIQMKESLLYILTSIWNCRIWDFFRPGTCIFMYFHNSSWGWVSFYVLLCHPNTFFDKYLLKSLPCFFFLESYIFIKFWEFKKIILDISPLCILIKYFLPICSNPLISFKSALWRTEVFNIGNSWIFLRLTFGGVFQLSWLPLRPKRICPRFSSRSFIFRPMVQLIFFVMWSMGWICLPVFIFLSFFQLDIWFNCSNTICWKGCLFSVELSGH